VFDNTCKNAINKRKRSFEKLRLTDDQLYSKPQAITTADKRYIYYLAKHHMTGVFMHYDFM